MKTLILFLAIIILYSCTEPSEPSEPVETKDGKSLIFIVKKRFTEIDLHGKERIKFTTNKDTTIYLKDDYYCLELGASILIGASSEWIEYNWGCADYKDYPDTIRLDTIFTDF